MNLVDSIELSTHVHATENEVKVVKALLNLVPPDLKNETNVNVIDGQGHYGNPIRTVKVQFRGEKSILVVKYILSSIDQLDKEIIIASLRSRFDGEKLYLRFNKQLAYNGIMRLDDGDDVVRVIVKFNHWALKNEGNIEDLLRKLMNIH
ncbi:MAG: RNA-binding domain-containing protein [Vulcanisaeta sp. AZ3]|jgi:RNA binding exosome subunit|nr:MAG: hypothetical protein TU36_01535 [Vulcanisaeta sp. AZ3]